MSDTLHQFLKAHASVQTINQRTYYILNTFDKWHAFTLKGEKVAYANSHAQLKLKIKSPINKG